MVFLIYFLGALICGAIASSIANAKYRSGCLFFILGFIIGPLAILGAAMMSRDQQAASRHGLDRGDLQRCPACREVIQPLAAICPLCRTTISYPPIVAEPGMLEWLEWLGWFIGNAWRRFW